MVVEIALGILLAVALIAAGLAAIGAFVKWFPEVLAFVVCVGSLWGLSEVFGGWGLLAWFSVLFGGISWYSVREEKSREAARQQDEVRLAEMREAERIEKLEHWAKLNRESAERQRRYSASRLQQADEDGQAALAKEARAAQRQADRDMCIAALREGREVIGIDGEKMTLKDFGIFH